jgi:hypothetical protein
MDVCDSGTSWRENEANKQRGSGRNRVNMLTHGRGDVLGLAT